MGFLSSVVSGGIDYFSAKDTNKKQKALAREQMAFQERMSNTAYQRAMKDMKEAGLNPMLAYAQGGASTQSGAQPTLQVPKVGDIALKGADVGSKTTQRKVQNQQIAASAENLAAQTATARQVERKEAAAADLARVEADFAKKHPNQYNAWKIGGWKAAAASTASDLVEGVSNTARDFKKKYDSVMNMRPRPTMKTRQKSSYYSRRFGK